MSQFWKDDKEGIDLAEVIDKELSGPEDLERCISIRGLWKVFGPDPDRVILPENEGKDKTTLQEELGCVIALKDVSFDVHRGETFVVMGLSGSGKSTLVRCITRLIEPNWGELYVDDEDIIKYSSKDLTNFRRTKTAMVFQHFGLFPNRTILDNVAFGLEIQGVDKESRQEKSREVLDLVGLKGWEDNHPTELSGGMQQRVGLARALAVDPEILLMDEPFSALDPVIRREMQDELIDLQTRIKKTIVFITHDLDEALKLGTRIAIMKDGEVIQLGSQQEIIDNPADEYVEDFIRSISRTRVLAAESIMREPRLVVSELDDPAEIIGKLEQSDEEYAFVVDSEGSLLGVTTSEELSKNGDSTDPGISSAIVSASPIFAKVESNTAIDELVPLAAGTECPVAVINAENKLLGVVTRGDLLVSLAESQLAQQGSALST